jgi:thiazole/oxazole-forming peptide maturase SagD family component
MTRVTHYPSSSHLMRGYRHIGANQTGIVPGFVATTADVAGEPRMRTMTVTMPHYHRLVTGNAQMHVEYHLSGYGLYNEEALLKLTGESVERYAAITAVQAFRDQLRYGTYREMASIGPTVPLEYLGIFTPEQQARLSGRLPRYADRPPTEDDIIGWIRCPSLCEPGTDVWVPAQLFFLAFVTSPQRGDLLFTPSFSTGTAAHTSLSAALHNALVEAVQIDAFILNWYTDHPCPRVMVDDADAAYLLDRLDLGEDSDYAVRPIYLTRPDLPLPTVGVFLESRAGGMPLFTFGVQGDPDPRYALVRGTMEAAAGQRLTLFNAVYDTTRIHSAVNSSPFLDLDTNVLYYGSPQDAQVKQEIVAGRFRGTVKLSEIAPLATSEEPDALTRLLRMVSTVSRWATYLDITPPELHDTPWKVVRVLIPELLSMCLPGLPSGAHPRMVAHGGVVHEHPHPLP